MHCQLARIPGANAANQRQRPADEVLCLARAIKLVVGDEQLRVAGRLKLRLEPSGVEQHRIQLLALARLGEVMREIKVIVAPGPRVALRVRGAVERRHELFVQRDEARLFCEVAQEVSGRVVQPQEALPKIEIEQERKVEESAQ